MAVKGLIICSFFSFTACSLYAMSALGGIQEGHLLCKKTSVDVLVVVI